MGRQEQAETAPARAATDPRGLYARMTLIRRFEERAAEAYARRRIGGFLHLYIGQEAVAVGAVGAMREDDYIISHYREHGHALARGLEPGPVMAELYGRADGASLLTLCWEKASLGLDSMGRIPSRCQGLRLLLRLRRRRRRRRLSLAIMTRPVLSPPPPPPLRLVVFSWPRVAISSVPGLFPSGMACPAQRAPRRG